ncbi:D-alanine--D-alanine ligase [Candidatus Sulfidibacterium hydrothermale]|uniref:D-alanine--D-alanine ligase n=1 Tax=Candidatus Sulfidibacterium hydrothermale TaxID=2875962 RepID=UPI001F0ABE33|nr:D-alanine--D-alanine ligase [Candidatus Sulfidibacterium hydrothermale]UBM63269.1 D-alanine--D-alanine ligase [Candidatus Sulfidibacterium hydrothermale]
MKKNIAVVCGGNSGEFEISMASGKMAYTHIDREKYNLFLIVMEDDRWFYLRDDGEKLPVNKSDFSVTDGKKIIRFDAVFNAIHGTPGEDGKLQGYFDLLHIPYTSCGVDASALSFNKFMCNRFIRSFGVKTAASFSFLRGEPIDKIDVLDALGLPVFIKPSGSGSSVGVSKVSKPEDFDAAVESAFREDNRILIEEAIPGREIACGVVRKRKELLVFPLTEIITSNEFFDYDAKYSGKSLEITPAELPLEAETDIKTLSSMLYRQMDCKGFVRFDYILTDTDLYFLELNSIPGMSEHSLIPQQAEAFGISLRELFTMVVDNLFEEEA